MHFDREKRQQTLQLRRNYSNNILDFILFLPKIGLSLGRDILFMNTSSCIWLFWSWNIHKKNITLCIEFCSIKLYKKRRFFYLKKSSSNEKNDSEIVSFFLSKNGISIEGGCRCPNWLIVSSIDCLPIRRFCLTIDWNEMSLHFESWCFVLYPSWKCQLVRYNLKSLIHARQQKLV